MSKFILPASVFGTVFGCAVLLKNHLTGGPCPSKARLPGKTVVITGANTGIGKETARELAQRGGRIIMGCRDMEKCEAAACEIRGSTLNPHVYARHINLSSVKSIRRFAEEINREEKSVDILINNAAVMKCPPGKTEDGFDMQFGVNYLGTGVTVNALHPGVVATDLGRHTGMHQSQFSSTVLSPIFYLFVKSPVLGAQPSVYLAVAEELEGVTGRYYDVMTEKEPAPQALEQEVAVRLWNISASMVGLNTTVPMPASSSKAVTSTTDPAAAACEQPLASPTETAAMTMA
ncbi:retinol dehydrogenase 13 isoform X3 [Electrophorus electricus]|uniref:retinol dehydrogenase 13 isoform X3 n=1 Tax=Electrophorus electricus TaxID=8005 RepID=UPI0015CFAFFF|nr:retinol dehydrogenase 13 isoform X3 [Electrophorus electricus]